MEQIHELNERKQEEERKRKYNADELFQNNEKQNIEENKEESKPEQDKNTALVEQKESFFKKIINKIKSLFGF